ncbi:MAG: hypothetical protein DRN81_03725 [Thermoproteota archaeon]|nr:MAG: hypothetical protein DRN81_03725 [Candidatus Korarchaeota archaeon]
MKVYTDGSGNGKVCYVTADGRVRIKEYENVTNNEAEYLAVLLAVKELKGNLDVYSDSQLVVQQLNRKWSIRKDRLRKYAEMIWKHCEHRRVRFYWIPREKNPAGKVLG